MKKLLLPLIMLLTPVIVWSQTGPAPCIIVPPCKSSIDLTLDANGRKIIRPEDVLVGNTPPVCDFRIEPILVTCSDVNPNGVPYRLYRIDSDGQEIDLCTGTIIVKDETAPTITCPPAVTVDCNADTSPAALGKATGEDACGVSFSYSDVVNPMGCSTIISRIWVATDPSGNIDSCIQEITVVPAPAVIDWPVNQQVECRPFDPNNTATDFPSSETGSPDVETCGQVSISFMDQVYQNANGTIIQRKWTVEDKCLGGIEEHLQVLTLVDTKGPMILSAPDVEISVSPFSLDCEAIANYPAPVVEDACSDPGDITLSYGPPAGTWLGLGETTVTLTATDPAGNSSSTTFKVTVVDAIAPSAFCNEDLIISLDPNGTKVTLGDIDKGSYDACDPNAEITITRDNVNFGESVDFFECDRGKTIEVTLKIVDASGNSNICSTPVMVQGIPESDPPVISCPPIIELFDSDDDGQETLDPTDLTSLYGVQVSDVCSEPVSLTISPASFPLDMFTPATITATDAAGNSSACNVDVSVKGPCSDVPTGLSVEYVTPFYPNGKGIVLFSWTDVGYDKCRIFIRRLNGNPNTLDTKWKAKSRYTETTSLAYLPDSLFWEEADYKWRIKCWCNSTETSWTNYSYFTFQKVPGPLLKSLDNQGELDAIALLPASGILVFPNPAQNDLNIHFGREERVKRPIRLVDLTGRTIKVLNLPPGQVQAQMDISDVAPGMYVLMVETDQGRQQYKVVVSER